ncbi:hypothetical protein [Microvirga splendida]|uniref:Uncharacterized protein n=1 Tax=Microvirga splendida TaxID=2795727 RepID=A0ABS0XYY0_9HYPH|nr:hypothetical protein [Microvirga splendida]MBJ6124950.1 hypothetical protein [Microvirga splendida]
MSASDKAIRISEVLKTGTFPIVELGMNYDDVVSRLVGAYEEDQNETARFLTADDLCLVFRQRVDDRTWALYHIYIYAGSVDQSRIMLPDEFNIDLEELRPEMSLRDFAAFLSTRGVDFEIRDILPDTKWVIQSGNFNCLFTRDGEFRLDSFVFLK